MRATFVFLLFVFTLIGCYNDVANAEKSVEVETPHIDSSNTLVTSDTVARRNLKSGKETAETRDVAEEERGSTPKLEGNSFWSRNFWKDGAWKNLFGKKSPLETNVESLAKNPKMPASLRKDSRFTRATKSVKAYFEQLDMNASPAEKLFFIALILFSLAAGFITISVYT